MTSSNMASNILFGSFQLATANFLGLNPAPVLGAQTAGGAIGAAICPGNIVLGCTTAGIMGQEGKVLSEGSSDHVGSSGDRGRGHVCDVYFVVGSIQ